jgi:hypothetical protein
MLVAGRPNFRRGSSAVNLELPHTTLADLPQALPPGKAPTSQITIARLGTYKDAGVFASGVSPVW